MMKRYFLMFVTCTVFRLVSYSVIIVYLDNWSIIPLIFIWTSSLIIRSSVIVHDVSQEAVLMVEDADDCSQKTTVVMERLESGLADSVLLDTTIGVFIPCFNIEVKTSNLQTIQKLEMKMKKYFQKQIIVTNIIITAVILIIFYLVFINKGFNYNNNIMDPLTFIVIIFSLVYLGVVGIILAHRLSCSKPFFPNEAKWFQGRKEILKFFKTLFAFLIIFSPIVIPQILLTTTQTTQKPSFVFYLQDPGEIPEVKIGILASWSISTTSILQQDVIIQGEADTSCSLFTNTTMEGKIFLLNTRKHQCRYFDFRKLLILIKTYF